MSAAVALRPAQGRARQGRQGRKHRGGAQGRGRREIEKSSPSRRRSGSNSRPTANTAAPGGISTFSACWTVSRSRTRPRHPVPGDPDQAAQHPGEGKIGFSDHPMLEHFTFLKAHTTVMPKMTIPSPSVFHFRLEPGAVRKDAYPGRDAIFEDLAAAYRTRCALSTRRLPLPAVRRHRLGLSVFRRRNSKRRASAASTSITCRSATPAPSTRRSGPSPPT